MQLILKHTRSYTDCIKMVQAEKNILDMMLVQNEQPDRNAALN